MTRQTAIAGAGAALLIGHAAAVAAPPQTTYPGQVTQARVWIQNQGRYEAVPVSLRDVALDVPMRVQETAPIALVPDTVVQARRVRQPWDYRVVEVNADNPLSALAGAGSEGWEATGNQLTVGNRIVIVMKRPR